MALARWQATIVDGSGNVQIGASVEVRRESDNVLVSLYTDRAGTAPAGNPVLADAEGYVYFHVAGGAYKITATLGAFTRVWRYVAIGTAAEGDYDFSQLVIVGSLSGDIINPSTSFSAESFGGDGYTVKGILGLKATWRTGNGGLNGAALVVDTIVESTAGTNGAPTAIFAGVKIEGDVSDGNSPIAIPLDPAGIVGNVWNADAVTVPHGCGLWGIVRGPKASGSDVDAIRASAENSTELGVPVAQNPRAGLIVFNSDVLNPFVNGVWVYSALTYGIRVGGTPSIAAQVIPAIPIAVDKTVGTTSADGILLRNETAAADGAQQFSPRMRWQGYGWQTGSPGTSVEVDWIAENQPYQGTPGTRLVFSGSIGGVDYYPALTMSATGIGGGAVSIGVDVPHADLNGGDLQLSRSGGATGALFFGNAASKYLFYNGSSFDLVGGRLNAAGLSSTDYIQMTEQAAPSAPATNSVRIYAEDDGNSPNKTRLMALFATGAAQQIAIEP